METKITDAKICGHEPPCKTLAMHDALQPPARHTPEFDPETWCGCQLNVSTKRTPITFCPLHSAAPDLLEAAKAAKELLEELAVLGTDLPARSERYQNLCAATAKATP